jgi:hypothetical protein
MNKTETQGSAQARSHASFEPIQGDLINALLTQADGIVAERARLARKLAEKPARRSVLARTTATLVQLSQTQVPLSSFVQILNRAVR